MEKGIQLLIQCRALVVCGSEITEGMQQEIRLAVKASISILTMDQFLSEELTNHVSDITDEMRAQEAEKRTSFRSQVLAAQTGQEHDSEIHMHRGFYSVSSEGDQLQPGFRASVRHTVSLIENQDQISDLTAVPISELIDRRDSNIIAERAAFHELSVSASGWEEVAAQTLLLNKAIEYLQTRPLVHSGNEWKEDWLGYHEISNMVYKMTWRIKDHTVYDSEEQKVKTEKWFLSWGLRTNTILSNTYADVSGHLLAGEENLEFSDTVALDRYLQERLSEHVGCFVEISPPVPVELAQHFSVGGKLLPGYTSLVSEREVDYSAMKKEEPKEKESVIAKIREAQAAAKNNPSPMKKKPQSKKSHEPEV